MRATQLCVSVLASLALAACGGGGGGNGKELELLRDARLNSPQDAVQIARSIAALGEEMQPEVVSASASTSQSQGTGLRDLLIRPKSDKKTAAASETHECESGSYTTSSEIRDVASPFTSPGTQFDLDIFQDDACLTHFATDAPGESLSYFTDGYAEFGEPVAEMADDNFHIFYIRFGTDSAWYTFERTHVANDVEDFTRVLGRVLVHDRISRWGGDPTTSFHLGGGLDEFYRVTDRGSGTIYDEGRFQITFGDGADLFRVEVDAAGAMEINGRLGYGLTSADGFECALGNATVTTAVPLVKSGSAFTGTLLVENSAREAEIEFQADGSYLVTLNGRTTRVTADEAGERRICPTD